MQNRKAGPRFVLVIADHIGIGHCPGCHKLPFTEGLHGAQPVAQGRGKFKLQFFGSALHLHAQFVRDLFIAALQNQHSLLHAGVILLLAARKLTPAVAVVHMKIEARPVLAKITRKLLGAARKLQRQAERVDHMLRNRTAAEGAEIAGLVPRRFADHLHGRVVLRQIDAQIGIPLVVFQENIILRHMPLDERAFEHQRLKL